MGAFEHVMALLSFVLALAITHLLSSAIEIARAGRRVQRSWIHGAWMLSALFTIVGTWIGMWDLHVVQRWTTGLIWLNLLMALGCYAFVGLLCPRIPNEGRLDLFEFHMTHRRQYIGVNAATGLAAIASALVYGDLLSVPSQNIQAIIIMVMVVNAVPAILFSNIWIQRIAALVQIAAWIAFFLIGDPVLS